MLKCICFRKTLKRNWITIVGNIILVYYPLYISFLPSSVSTSLLPSFCSSTLSLSSFLLLFSIFLLPPLSSSLLSLFLSPSLSSPSRSLPLFISWSFFGGIGSQSSGCHNTSIQSNDTLGWSHQVNYTWALLSILAAESIVTPARLWPTSLDHLEFCGSASEIRLYLLTTMIKEYSVCVSGHVHAICVGEQTRDCQLDVPFKIPA